MSVRARAPAAWRVAVTVPAAAAEPFERMLAADAPAVSVFGADDEPLRQVEGFAVAKPDATALALRVAVLARALDIAEPPLTVERIPPTDWLAATRRAFPPIRIGRFFVHGSHVEGGVPAGAVALRIDASTAFGSGDHPTTAGCLTALERLAKRRRIRRALDMGCGTGILAIAIAKAWRVPVVAADIDPEAVRVAQANARANRIAGLVAAAPSDGYAGTAVRAGAPYDLIVANILAGPLARMAKDLAADLASGGTAVLSGLLARQEAQVLAAHRTQGLALQGRVALDGWSTLVLAKRPRPPATEAVRPRRSVERGLRPGSRRRAAPR